MWISQVGPTDGFHRWDKLNQGIICRFKSWAHLIQKKKTSNRSVQFHCCSTCFFWPLFFFFLYVDQWIHQWVPHVNLFHQRSCRTLVGSIKGSIRWSIATHEFISIASFQTFLLLLLFPFLYVCGSVDPLVGPHVCGFINGISHDSVSRVEMYAPHIFFLSLFCFTFSNSSIICFFFFISSAINGDGAWWKIILTMDFLDFKVMGGSKKVRGKRQADDDIAWGYCSKVKEDVGRGLPHKTSYSPNTSKYNSMHSSWGSCSKQI